jgi:putative ABC transport system substrate-binding protein
MKKPFTLALAALLILFAFAGCSKKDADKKSAVPTVGFVQATEDATISEAKTGFYDALKQAGFSDSLGTVKIIYRNAQGDITVLNQIIDYFISEKVTLIAANTTLAALTSVNKTKTIPIFEMVAPSPDIANLLVKDSTGKLVVPANLSGVYETLNYMNETMKKVREVFPKAKRIGVLYNGSEPNSTNSMARLRELAKPDGLEIVEAAITSSNESQQAVESLLNQKIDLFFALPDNVVFASFETIYKAATDKKVPIVTSEVGLVKRGAFIAYGADFYQWGFQAGQSAAEFLKTKDLTGVPLKTVSVRKATYNPETAKLLGLQTPVGFEAVKP